MGTVAIHASWSPGEVRVAAVADSELVDYAIWRPGAPDGLGDVFRGRITARMPAMAGAFVVLGGAVANGFLPDSEGAKDRTEGTVLTVRVTRAALGGKGPRLTAREDDAGRHAGPHADPGPLGLIRRGPDPLAELAARYPDAPVHLDDAGLFAAVRPALRERARLDKAGFDDAIETSVAALGAPEITLPSGVRLSVRPTPALVAIDIDGGAALTGRDGKARAHRALNEAVVSPLARQIRLRNLSGAILVDFAGMKAKQRASLAPALTAALADDPLRPRFLGFTALGFAEISRPRTRPPLHELLAGPHAVGLAALRALWRASTARPGAAFHLRAAPTVAAALVADPIALAELARATGRSWTPRTDPSLPTDTWHIEDPDG